MAALWRSRFLRLGVTGLMKDAPRPGRTPAIAQDKVAEVIARTTQSNPDGATHWSRSRMAREMGAGHAAALLREFQIPSVFQMTGAFDRLTNGELVSLDAVQAQRLSRHLVAARPQGAVRSRSATVRGTATPSARAC